MIATDLIKKLAGPLGGVVGALLLGHAGYDPVICRTAAVAIWMALWWITEAVNIYFTGLLPVILFPLLGIAPMKAVAPMYMKDVLFLFIGGFVIAFAFERWNLHRRIALRIIGTVGGSPPRLLAGFMIASWFLSMWILNTATATLLLPSVLAVITQLEERGHRRNGLATALLLGVAYASSIGGTATLIGTLPNLVLLDFWSEHYQGAVSIDFAHWFMFGLPLSILVLGVAWLLLRLIYLGSGKEEIDTSWHSEAVKKMGPTTYEEYVLGFVFLLTVGAWFTLKGIDFGGWRIPGWGPWLEAQLGVEGFIKESTIAITMAGLLFLWPSRNQPRESIASWREFQRVPLGIIFLFGGGFALASGIESSGLGKLMSSQLEGLAGLPPFLLILSLCLFTTFFTELTSNTASTILLLNFLAPMTSNLELHPLIILLPVTISASFAFMLPAATPPNTIVFGSERLTIRDMMRGGLGLNLICAFLVTLAALTFAGRTFGF